MRVISPNTKTVLSVSGAFVLAIALAGCTNAPAPTSVADAPQTSALTEKTANAATIKPNLEPTDSNLKSITWLTSYDKALNIAKENNRPVLIDFYADWCTACKVLDKEIYTAPDVIKKSKEFINLKIDADKDTEIAARYKVYALPTLIFLDGNGKVLWRLEGVPTTSHFINTMQKVQNKFISEA